MQAYNASFSFFALGNSAQSAIPQLTNRLYAGQYPQPAAVALVGIGSNGIPYVLRATTNTNYVVRFAATWALAFEKTGSSEIVTSLLQCLNDAEMTIQISAMHALGELKRDPDRVVPYLIPKLTDFNAAIRRAGIDALGSYGSRAANGIPALLPLLKDPNAIIRQVAASAVGSIASGVDPQQRNEIAELLKTISVTDTNLAVQRSCEDALKELSETNIPRSTNSR